MNREERDAAIDAAIVAWYAQLWEQGEQRYAPQRAADQPSITCPVCGRTSYHPEDVRQGYCGWCHDWTSPPGGNNPAPVS